MNFIDRNPVIEGFQAGQRMQDEAQARELRMLQMENERRRVAEEAAATQALQNLYARRPTAESYERTAAAPGLSARTRIDLGERGMQMRQREIERREKRAKDMADFLKAGLIGPARQAAADAGIAVPDDFWTNREKQAQLLQKLETDLKQSQIEANTARAQYYRGEGRQGAGGRMSVFQQKVALYKAAYPEKSEAEILEMADGRKPPNVAELRARAFIIAQRATDHLGRPLYKTPEEQRRAADETLQYMLGGMPAAPEPATLPPAAAPAPPPSETAAAPQPQQAGTEDSPHRPQSQQDFAAIPSGQFFINPADGQLYRKK